MQATEKCDNCGKEFPESKINSHFGYCRRNIKKCDTCNQMIDINYREEHNEQFHSSKQCQYCKKSVPSAELNKHQNTCTSKPKFCDYCELNIAPNEFKNHQNTCGSRTKKCNLCEKNIILREYDVHVMDCTGKLVSPPKPPTVIPNIEANRKPVVNNQRNYNFTQEQNQIRRQVYENKKPNEMINPKNDLNYNRNVNINNNNNNPYNRQEIPIRNQISQQQPINRQDIRQKPNEVPKEGYKYEFKQNQIPKQIVNRNTEQYQQFQKPKNEPSIPARYDVKPTVIQNRIPPSYNIQKPGIDKNLVNNNLNQNNIVRNVETREQKRQLQKRESEKYNIDKGIEKKISNRQPESKPYSEKQRNKIFKPTIIENNIQPKQNINILKPNQKKGPTEAELYQQRYDNQLNHHEDLLPVQSNEDLQLQRALMQEYQSRLKKKNFKVPKEVPILQGMQDLGIGEDAMSQSFYRDLSAQTQIQENIKQNKKPRR